MRQTKKALTAENTFTSAIKITAGLFAVDITGTFVGTITVQACREDDFLSTPVWIDLSTTYTTPVIDVGEEGSIHYYRAGFKTGGFTSGTATVAISQAEEYK